MKDKQEVTNFKGKSHQMFNEADNIMVKFYYLSGKKSRTSARVNSFRYKKL